MKKIFSKIKNKVGLLLTKVINYVNNHDKERMNFGAALCGSSFVLLVADTQFGNGILGAFPSLLTAICMVIGMLLIADDATKVERFFEKLMLGILKLLLILIATYLLIYGIKLYAEGKITDAYFVLMLILLTYLTYYVIRLILGLFSLVKKVIINIGKKCKIDLSDASDKTKLIGEILKNLLSIAGTVGLIIAWISPIIQKIINYVTK